MVACMFERVVFDCDKEPHSSRPVNSALQESSRPVNFCVHPTEALDMLYAAGNNILQETNLTLRAHIGSLR